MKFLLVCGVISLMLACHTPNVATSSQLPANPTGATPSTALPPAGSQTPHGNRIEPTTGTAQTPAALPDSTSGTTGADSTAHR